MKELIKLKYPEGEFTQAELAAFNGVETAIVYLSLRAALAEGVLVISGTRPTGKRPLNVYCLSTNAKNNAPLPITEVPEAKPLSSEPLTPAIVPEAPAIVQEVNPVPLRFMPMEVTPAETKVVAILEVTPDPVISVKATNYSAPNPAFPCPLCEGPMSETTDDTGVMLKCFNTPCDPMCHENPYGHGKNAKDAY